MAKIVTAEAEEVDYYEGLRSVNIGIARIGAPGPR